MEKILILDFGSQYTQLIARRVRELNVYCEIHPFNKIPALDASVRGVILSGSPYSVRDAQAPNPDLSAFKGKLPLLGVCYGAQFLASAFGGEVQPAPSREYGRAMLSVGDPSDALMRDLPARTQVWMSHGDTITRVPDNYKLIASTEDVRVAAFRIAGEQTWGIQFHPEVYHSTDGTQLLKNFVVGICGCSQSWTSESFVESTVRELREKVGDDKVVLGLSGGVRFVGGRRAAAQGHRQEPLLHLRRFGTAAQERVRRRAGVVQEHGSERQGREGWRRVPAATWPASPTPSASARSSAATSWRCSTRRRSRSRTFAGWRRVRSTRT